jgi:hypothetical protein
VSEHGDWYATYARMPLRTRLMSLVVYTGAGALAFAAIDSLTGGSLRDGLVRGLIIGAWIGVFTVFLVPTLVMWWRRRQRT